MLRVVVVDDEPAVGRALGRLLTARGVDVRVCTGGPQALALLEVAPADVVLSDFTMPGMNGIELLSEVRRRWPATRRVLVSALVEALTPEQLAACGPCVLVKKPFDEAELLAALEGGPA